MLKELKEQDSVKVLKKLIKEDSQMLKGLKEQDSVKVLKKLIKEDS